MHAFFVCLTFSFPWKGVFKNLLQFTKAYTKKMLTFTEHYVKHTIDFASSHLILIAAP